jgi:hypothetical protein
MAAVLQVSISFLSIVSGHLQQKLVKELREWNSFIVIILAPLFFEIVLLRWNIIEAQFLSFPASQSYCGCKSCCLVVVVRFV